MEKFIIMTKWKAPKEVPKTEKERDLNAFYMVYIKSDKIIPQHIVKGFKLESDAVRKRNHLYNKKTD